jgi:hypothetical protein
MVMKNILTICFMLLSSMLFGQIPKGAWQIKESNGLTSTMIITDNYLVMTTYGAEPNKFEKTEGGTFTFEAGKINYKTEFNTSNPEAVGEMIVFTIKRNGKMLTMKSKHTQTWTLVDDAQKNAMAGTWRITARAGDDGKMNEIHQTGTRQTLKILSATRFQWVAIDPAVKGFYGTGGGTYTAEDGKYTENIEFFSRDNSRVGASLSFGWKLENGKWDHSGNSSAGKPIHEIWEKNR